MKYVHTHMYVYEQTHEMWNDMAHTTNTKQWKNQLKLSATHKMNITKKRKNTIPP